MDAAQQKRIDELIAWRKMWGDPVEPRYGFGPTKPEVDEVIAQLEKQMEGRR
jgi:hypothetical protein